MRLLHALFHAQRHHHGHGHHHPHGHHHQHGRHDADGHGTSRLDHLASQISHKLDLNDDQQAKLTLLLNGLHAQRQSLRGDALMLDVQQLVSGTSLNRSAAQAMLDTRIASAQAAAPALIAALADFYDALDTEQQQVLRFLLRLGQRHRGHGHPAQ